MNKKQSRQREEDVAASLMEKQKCPYCKGTGRTVFKCIPPKRNYEGAVSSVVGRDGWSQNQ